MPLITPGEVAIVGMSLITIMGVCAAYTSRSCRVCIAFQQIPLGDDKFEFAKTHAIEGLRKYKVGRDKLIQELNVS